MKDWQALPEERCGNCKYFRQHYIQSSRGRYRPLQYGHCVHPKLKNAGWRSIASIGPPKAPPKPPPFQTRNEGR